jgi:hypothetical protein
MDDMLTITLDPSVEAKGTKVAQIMLREPLAREVVAAEKTAAKMQGIAAERQRDTAMVALVAGISEDHVRAMPVSKSAAAAKFLNGFVMIESEKVDRDPPPDLQIVIDPAVVVHNTTCDLLDLREPTGAEMDAAYIEMGLSPTSYGLRKFQIMLVARVSGLNRAIIEALPISVVNQATQYLMGFT